MHRWLNTLLLIVGWWVGLACGLDNTDDRMLRRYAVCLTDANTALYRMTTSSASGTVTLRRGDGEAVAWSAGERGVHHGEDQGRLRPLL